jgi:hypothetical protein
MVITGSLTEWQRSSQLQHCQCFHGEGYPR